MNNYREIDYEMLARHYSGVGNDQKVAKALARKMEAGEHQHHILQALCRSAIRQGNGSSDTPCNAYIIAPKRSGVRAFLPEVFPGCSVLPWLPTKAKPKGKVQEALTFIEMFFEDYPDQVLPFAELRQELGGTSVSNFNSRIRNHPNFKAGLITGNEVGHRPDGPDHSRHAATGQTSLDQRIAEGVCVGLGVGF
jgi:hypothetical protein